MTYKRFWYDHEEKDAQGSTVLRPDEPARPVAPPEPAAEPSPGVLPGASVYFSPGKDPEENIKGFIQRTKETLDIALFAFTSREILKALREAISRAVKVRMVMDQGQAAMKNSCHPLLVPVLGNNIILDRSEFQQHNKFAISDGKAVITGSYNWSDRATKNMENLVILRDPTIVKSYMDYYSQLWISND
jgi:phosphatidylserine/phosphatidylglycerophosphate/cardiolipin synthase-like enzyme